jgi:hypothetical protein
MAEESHSYGGFQTQELPLAAFIRARGHEATLIPPDTSNGFFSFAFQGDPEELEDLAEEFASGGSIPAFRFYSALNSLKGEIRLARGEWR